MAKDLTRSNAIYASDLLGNTVDADTLDGLDSDQFLRSDVTSFPLVDNFIDLGSTTRRFHRIFVKELWGIDKINGDDFSLFLKRNQHNIPIINSDGITGYDFGSINFYWRAIYANTGNFKSIYTDKIVTSDGELYSHTKLKDIGLYTHNEIDNHINTRSVQSINGGSNVHGATWNNLPNALVARDFNGSIWVNTMYGIASKALYADLAEKYTTLTPDAPIGTVFNVTGNNDYDVEICYETNCSNVVGVVSEKPAYVMNDSIEGVTLGLKGKLKVRVVGKVYKGDILISAGTTSEHIGCACNINFKYSQLSNVLNTYNIYKIGIANETNLDENEKLIEAIV